MKFFKSLNMKMRKPMATGILVVGIAMLIQVQMVQAQSDSTDNLADLVDNDGTLTIGDKTFSGFGWIASGADASELNTDAAGLTVTASIAGGVDYLDFGGLIAVNNLGGTDPLF